MERFFTISKIWSFQSSERLRCNFYNNYIHIPWWLKKLEDNPTLNFWWSNRPNVETRPQFEVNSVSGSENNQNVASKNKNRELGRLLGDVLRFQNHLQSSCSISFVTRNHQLSAQLRLSFEIGDICGFGSSSILGLVRVYWANWHLILCKFASKIKNRELVRLLGDVLRFQNHLQSSCSIS